MTSVCGRVCLDVKNAARAEECAMVEKSAKECVGLGFKLFFCFDDYFVPKSFSSFLLNFSA